MHNLTVAIHQPNYLPWAGYFYKAMKADVFVFLDNVQYSKNSFINRNRIKGQQGAQWLTIPVRAGSHITIDRVSCSDRNWHIKHMKTLDACYARAPYYEQYRDDLRELYAAVASEKLSAINMALIRRIAEWLRISCAFRSSSEFDTTDSSDGRLIEIVKLAGGGRYLSGHGAAAYQDERRFVEAGIELHYYTFKPPRYPQLFRDFVPGLSIVDLLFNAGDRAADLLARSCEEEQG